MFHSTFLDILGGQDPLDKLYAKTCDIDIGDINKYPKTADTVKKIAPFLLQKIKRTQKLIETDSDYYVAQDIHTLTKYICFRDFLMVDIDLKYFDMTQDAVIAHFSAISGHAFAVYESANGFHAFCVSKRFKYRDADTMQFLIENKCDFFYAIYCYIRGFSVRLNRKFMENPGCLYTRIAIVGDVEPDEELMRLLDKHDKLSKAFCSDVNLQGLPSVFDVIR